MNIVIPMAGLGHRFQEAGYQTPKPLLEAHGKKLLEWSVDSLPLELASQLIFVGLKEHKDTHDMCGIIMNTYARYQPTFLWLDSPTRGQAETVYMARSLINAAKGLLIFNIDTAFHSARLRDLLAQPTHDGVLGAFTSSEPRFSYARIGENGYVTEVREKQVISAHALTGLYHFSSASSFLDAAADALLRDEREKGEFYVAPLYNKLIEKGERFVIDVCDQHVILGTPLEYQNFLEQDSARLLI